jgi:membrane-bound lytic murein transglycosylase F
MEFTDPILETRQVLVQHKPKNWRSMTPEAMDKHLVRDQLDLAGKTIYVQENSAHLESLRSLESEIGDSINIIPVPYESEELIQNVVRGDIDYTVCDENVAMVNSTYYPEIDIATPVSFRQNIAWGIRKTGSEQLLAGLNSWINSFTRTRSYALLYAKYFKNTRSVKIVNSDYYSLSTGKISVWDDLIRNASRDINWDWLLLASLIYQESRFDPDVESEAGAVGLMQVMPQTGEKFGIDIQVSPANNIKAGTLYIRQLQKIFETKVSDPQERLKFVLASYNAGPGHVLDAMRLAEKNGLNHQIWDDNVAAYLLKKSQPQYFNDAVVKNGYFRGTESINFVNEILDRYDHYRNLITVGNNSLSMITRQD